jgi:ABC-type multidrug transport system fused ATPase/permease subunit
MGYLRKILKTAINYMFFAFLLVVGSAIESYIVTKIIDLFINLNNDEMKTVFGVLFLFFFIRKLLSVFYSSSFL